MEPEKAAKKAPTLLATLAIAVVVGLLVVTVGVSAAWSAQRAAPAGTVKAARGTTAQLVEWRRPDTTPMADLNQSMVLWKSRGGTAMAVDVSFIADATDAGVPKATIYRQLNAYVRQAALNGLRVSAVAGDPRWMTDPAWIDTIVAAVSGYNAAYPKAKLAGLTWDVEVWSGDAYTADPAGTVAAWLGWVRTTAAKNPGVPVGFYAPYWFDGRNPAVASVTFDGTSATPAAHLARILSGTPGAYVDIMAYQDTVDRAVAAVTPWSTLGVPFRAATEIGPSDAGSTWYGQPWSAASAAISAEESAFGTNTSFRGVDVDSAQYLR